MSRLEFYIDKARFLAAFIWWREWRLVRDEWSITYEEMLDVIERAPEIEREAVGRLLKAVEEEACRDSNSTS